MQVMTLEGGIKGWVKAGPQYIKLMDGFNAAHWEKLSAEQPNQQQAEPQHPEQAKISSIDTEIPDIKQARAMD